MIGAKSLTKRHGEKTAVADLIFTVRPGVVTGCGEYGTGMIRASVTAVPRRLPVLWAKAAVYAAVTWVSMTAATVAAFLLSRAILASRGLASASLGDPGVSRAVLGSAAYLTVTAVLSVAIGALTRATAGGAAVMLRRRDV